jgi:hypothetical protein
MNQLLSEAATRLHDLCHDKPWYVCVGVGICDGRGCVYLYVNTDQFDQSMVPYEELGIKVPLVWKKMDKAQAIEHFDGIINIPNKSSNTFDKSTA